MFLWGEDGEDWFSVMQPRPNVPIASLLPTQCSHCLRYQLYPSLSWLRVVSELRRKERIFHQIPNVLRRQSRQSWGPEIHPASSWWVFPGIWPPGSVLEWNSVGRSYPTLIFPLGLMICSTANILLSTSVLPARERKMHSGWAYHAPVLT